MYKLYCRYMNRTTVLLIFGGESSEHDVSIMSAKNVHAAMSEEKYDTVYVNEVTAMPGFTNISQFPKLWE